MISKKWLLAVGASSVLAFGVAACGDDDDSGDSGGGSGLSGTIRIDGSSTVAPLTSIAAEEFQAANEDVNVTVGTSGTSGGSRRSARIGVPHSVEQRLEWQGSGVEPLVVTERVVL